MYNDGDVTAAYVVVPPDGGWGWVIMIASFSINFLADGHTYAFSALQPALKEEFGNVATVIALLSGLEAIVGPIVSALCNRWGFRIVAILGAIIAGFGFCISYYANSIGLLCFTYGVLGGIGLGMTYMPAVIAVGFYFERWRALATCIAVCGTAVGGTVLNRLVGFIVKRHGWRIAVVAQGGLVTCAIFFALLLRPLHPIRVATNITGDAGMSIQQLRMASISGRPTPVASQRISVSTTSMTSEPSSARSLARTGGYFIPNTAFPTAAQMVAPGSSTSFVDDTKSVRSVFNAVGSRNFSASSMRLASPSSVRAGGVAKRNCCSKMWRKLCRHRWNEISARPFYRDDIMYAGSLARLPQYNSLRDDGEYHMTVTRAATLQDEHQTAKCCILCPEAVTRILATMLDFKLFVSPTFLLLITSMCLFQLTTLVPYTYMPDRSKRHGIDSESIAALTLTINIANVFGRILGGVISFFPRINALIVFNITLTIAGIVTLISGITYSVPFQMFYCAMYGLTTAVILALRPVLLVDMLGLTRLTNAFGLLLLFTGLSTIIGLNISGILEETSGNYDGVFFFSGAAMLSSGVLLYPLSCVNRREKEKALKITTV